MFAVLFRIVLDTDNGCWDTILAVSLEIDDSVFSSGTATTDV